MEFIGDIARKTADPSHLRVEAEKSRLAGRIGERSDLFRVPRVLNFDEQAGVLDFERIPDLITYTELVMQRQGPYEELASRAGRALAHVHAELVLHDEMRTPLPPEWLGSERPDVCLHGDFTSNNICVDLGDMSLVIVDWSGAPLVGRGPTVGPGCFDVVWFVRHLSMVAPFAQTLRWPAETLCNRFIRGYVEEASEPIEGDIWRRHHEQLDEFTQKGSAVRGSRGSLLTRSMRTLAQSILYRSWQRYEPPSGSLT